MWDSIIRRMQRHSQTHAHARGAAAHVLDVARYQAAPALGWCWRSGAALAQWLWATISTRVLIVLIGLWLALPPWWAATTGGTPDQLWAAVITAIAAALWWAACGTVFHLWPHWSRPLSIVRTAGYAALIGPLALAAGSTITPSATGHLIGIALWTITAAGLVMNLLMGPEFRQSH